MAGFKESSFVFTDPIRYFKENDPYYWEVDNIPLKQLQENCMWLKGQIASNPAADGVDRNELNELRPYSEGNTNIIKVKPGRFTARINDAYNKDPLQKLQMLTGDLLASYESFNNPSGLTLAEAVLTRIQSTVSTNALSLNGLIERVLSWPVINDDEVYGTQIVNSFPVPGSTSYTKWPLLSTFPFVPTLIQAYGAAGELPRISAEFIKQFRGVARTAVVDVPEELSIQIPNFDANDFFTIDSTGTKTLLSNASVRIDLLFVYSKPVDVSSTTLQKWSGGQPVTITKPILGLVRGAGVGINRSDYSLTPARDAGGNTQILADYKDSLLPTNGFQATSIDVHGSFPSPDDLMNIAPIISEKLSETDTQLVGQTILPLAYIVVRKNAIVNSLGNVVLSDSDVIDIRPFFRTTELTYGERAGLAAALPSPSLANPVVTQYNLDNQVNGVKSYIDSEITRITGLIPGDTGGGGGGGGSPIVTPRTVAGGTIWGGLNFGPEGAINTQLQTLGQENIFDDNTVPEFPDWDLAGWWNFDPPTGVGGAGRGELRGDRLNFSYLNTFTFLGGGIDSLQNTRLYFWVQKRINIDRTAVPWMQDYEVKLNYKNCVPTDNLISKQIATGSTSEAISFNAPTGLYYEKFSDHFMVYVFYEAYGILGVTSNVNPRSNRTSAFNNFTVFSKTFPDPTQNNGLNILGGVLNPIGIPANEKNPFVTSCSYPTVSFEVVGFPSTSYYGRLPQDSTPTINLR
jgi:hypothetical protein